MQNNTVLLTCNWIKFNGSFQNRTNFNNNLNVFQNISGQSWVDTDKS